MLESREPKILQDQRSRETQASSLQPDLGVQRPLVSSSLVRGGRHGPSPGGSVSISRPSSLHLAPVIIGLRSLAIKEWLGQLRNQGELGSQDAERLGLSREHCLTCTLTHNCTLQLTPAHRISLLRNPHPAKLTVEWGKWGNNPEGALERKTRACLHS